MHLAGTPTAMVLDGHHLWVADTDNDVVEVEAPSLHVVRSVSVPAGPSSLALLGAHVWVTSQVANEITSIDTRSGATGSPSIWRPGPCGSPPASVLCGSAAPPTC